MTTAADPTIPAQDQPGGADRRPEPADVRRRVWWSAFLILAAVMGLWSLSMPLFSSPDEPAHVIKAAAVVRGQLGGHDVSTSVGTVTHVRVPAALVGANALRPIPCFGRHPKVPANCQHLPTASGTVDAGTQAGHYPPEYYAIVGIPSLIAPDRIGLYLMRFVSVLLGAALLASALLSVRRWRSGPGPLALAVAVTPMVLFMSAGVNPSGLEITSAIGVWAAGLAVLDDPQRLDRRLVVRLGVAAVLLVLCRSLSPLWLAVIVVVCLMSAGLDPVRLAWARREVKICAGAVSIATACAMGWILFAHALALRPNRHVRALPLSSAIEDSFKRTPHRIDSMVGYFGWLDTAAPWWTYAVWAALTSLLVMLCLAMARRRVAVALVVLLLTVLVLPIAIEVSQERSLGFVWQGRYTLPMAVGVPLLAGRHADLGRLSAPEVGGGRFASIGLALVLSGQFFAFVWNLRRNTVGIHGSWIDLIHVRWHPPLPPLLLVVLFAFSLVLLGLRLRSAPR